jgi:hypothetical protein
MGLLAFTEFCIWAVNQPGRSENPYTVHPACIESMANLVYLPEFWYGLVCTRHWAASLYEDSEETA